MDALAKLCRIRGVALQVRILSAAFDNLDGVSVCSCLAGQRPRAVGP